MKILTVSSTEIYGPFTTIVKDSDYYLADDDTRLYVEGTISDVPNDWVNPNTINEETYKYNDMQRALREKEYKQYTDPIFFQVQRGIYTNEEWLASIENVKLRYPYKEVV
jgi:hypothetical protein